MTTGSRVVILSSHPQTKISTIKEIISGLTSRVVILSASGELNCLFLLEFPHDCHVKELLFVISGRNAPTVEKRVWADRSHSVMNRLTLLSRSESNQTQSPKEKPAKYRHTSVS